jgi:feruloyl esterase
MKTMRNLYTPLKLSFRMALAGLSIWAMSQPVLAAEHCDVLAGQVIGNATVLSTQSIDSGTFTPPGQSTIGGLPKFCRILARSAPSPESNIIIEIWLPHASSWNGKIMGTGNGAFAGAIKYAALAGGVKRGYATSNTDLGTHPASTLPPGLDYTAGIGRPEMIKDWGHRATHEMAVLTRKVTNQYYGKAAKHAYFVGCSTGGHQGLMTAQRYPGDYDAILAGAPGHNRTHLHAMFTDLKLKMQRADAGFTQDKLALWTEGYLQACAGKDGGAPDDRFLTDPTQCDFSPSELQCKSEGSHEQCLTEKQTRLLNAIYDGTRNPRTGELIYPPTVPGTEFILSLFGLTDPNVTKTPVNKELHQWVFAPDWDPASFDFDQDMQKVDKKLGPDINAMNPDLSEFAKRGGKLILFHGWADMVVSPIDTIVYYDEVHANTPNARDFMRLFLAPGVSHCQGGEGADVFGQSPEYASAGIENDLLDALDHWVENDVAPNQVLARKYPQDVESDMTTQAKPIATRPLCAYPAIAKYDGKGKSNNANSFSCQEAPLPKYERPAPRYRH